MEIIKIVGIALITCVANIMIKQVKPELSILVVLSGGSIILLTMINSLSSLFGGYNDLFSLLNIDSSLVKCIIKIIGTGYLVEFGASICVDSGHSSLAEKIILAGKIAILIMCLPIIKNLIQILLEIMP